MQCCDCGLIHRFNFRIRKDKGGRRRIQLQGFRLDEANDKPMSLADDLRADIDARIAADPTGIDARIRAWIEQNLEIKREDGVTMFRLRPPDDAA